MTKTLSSMYADICSSSDELYEQAKLKKMEELDFQYAEMLNDDQLREDMESLGLYEDSDNQHEQHANV